MGKCKYIVLNPGGGRKEKLVLDIEVYLNMQISEVCVFVCVEWCVCVYILQVMAS